MLPAYKKWIETNVKGAGYGECADITVQMQEAFPELLRKRGSYRCPVWGDRTHWWLTTVSGEIVDPTANQFPSKGNFEYTELSEAEISELPTGVCLECGGPVYNGRDVCSDDCYNAFRSSLMGVMR